MVVLDNLVVSVALPSIHNAFGASIQSLEWTVNAYVLAFAVLLLTGAALGDRFGRKRMFLAGLALFTVSSAAAALALLLGAIPKVIGFAVILTLLTGLTFGILPALRLTRTEAADALRSGGRAARVRMVIGTVVSSSVARAIVISSRESDRRFVPGARPLNQPERGCAPARHPSNRLFRSNKETSTIRRRQHWRWMTRWSRCAR